jgi:hypothetical protein
VLGNGLQIRLEVNFSRHNQQKLGFPLLCYPIGLEMTSVSDRVMNALV